LAITDKKCGKLTTTTRVVLSANRKTRTVTSSRTEELDRKVSVTIDEDSVEALVPLIPGYAFRIIQAGIFGQLP
jgi:hypothetical protein